MYDIVTDELFPTRGETNRVISNPSTLEVAGPLISSLGVPKQDLLVKLTKYVSGKVLVPRASS
jgi:hypothetical protein